MKVKVKDHCQTAADVRAANARVRAFRKLGRGPLPLVEPPPKTSRTWPRAIARPAPPAFGVGVGHAFMPYNLVQVGHGRRHALRVTDVLEAVALFTGVSIIDIKSHRRAADVVLPRHLVMALARRLTLRSLPEIGRMLGGRDHTTVLHAHQKYKPLLDALAEVIGEDASLDVWIAEAWKVIRDHKAARAAPKPEQQVAA